MGYVPWDRYNDQQREMIRRVRHLCGCAHEILESPETLECEFDDDRRGVRVGVNSWFPEARLRKIQQAAFSTFEFPGMRTDDRGVVWTHFRLG